MRKQECLSQSKYAEHRNVTKGYIGRLIKEGRLHLIKGKLNVAMSDAELDNKSNDEKAPNYWIEKALHEKAKRELAELDLKLKQDQLVEVDQVGDHLDKIFSAVRPTPISYSIQNRFTCVINSPSNSVAIRSILTLL